MEICKRHNFIVYEKDHDWDICTECGTKKTFGFAKQANQYNYPNGDIKIVEQKTISLDKSFDCVVSIDDGDSITLSDMIEDKNQAQSIEKIEDAIDISLALKKLTERQRKVAELILDGKTQKQIAKELKITEMAVKNRFRLIKQKLGTKHTKSCHN